MDTKRTSRNSLDASQGGNIHNFGKLDVENTIKLNTPSIVYNAPECKIEAKTYEAAGSTNVNFGEMEFDTYDSGGAGGSLYNKLYAVCRAHEGRRHRLSGSWSDSRRKKKTMKRTNSSKKPMILSSMTMLKVTLANGSMIKAKKYNC